MTTAREQTLRLADLLRREHHALAEFLVALAAFDEAKGWVEMGHKSLFCFLLRELGLPKGPAYYRMTAAGLIRKDPELVEPLRDGRLHLTSVTQLARVITPENRAEVLPRFFHLSKREAKEVVAELAPAAAPPLRTVVTPVRRSAPPAQALASAPAFAVLPEELAPAYPAGQTGHLGDVPEVAPVPAAPREQPTQIDPLTSERSRLHVTVARRFHAKLSAARDALSHSHPGASEETTLEVGLDLILKRYAERRGIGAKPRATAPRKAGAARTPPSTRRSRHVPAAVWRAVWERDRGCCAWPLANGGVCASTDQLELDHVKGWALGAGTTVEECRLLCRWHQDLSARQLYGDDLMNNYTRPKGPTCSEPIALYGAARTAQRSGKAAASERLFLAGPREGGEVGDRLEPARLLAGEERAPAAGEGAGEGVEGVRGVAELHQALAAAEVEEGVVLLAVVHRQGDGLEGAGEVAPAPAHLGDGAPEGGGRRPLAAGLREELERRLVADRRLREGAVARGAVPLGGEGLDLGGDVGRELAHGPGPRRGYPRWSPVAGA
jgi:hypothetical protein